MLPCDHKGRRGCRLALQHALTGEGFVPPAKHGVVYTRRWVVDLILDLAGFISTADLGALVAVEPAAGDGAFLVPMVRRLVASAQQRNRPIQDCVSSLLIYELDELSARAARTAVIRELGTAGLTPHAAAPLAAAWVRTGDYLLEAPALPTADFVIGNPPYIRLEDIDARVAASYRAQYRAMTGRADIYIAFFEAALRQLTPTGVCAFICADRWMLNQYGTELRRLVTGQFGVEAVVEMHTADAFDFDVSAYPAVTVIRRGAQGPAVVATAGPAAQASGGAALARSLSALRSGIGETELPGGLKAARVEAWFEGADPWPCVSPERLALLKHLEATFAPLESATTRTKVGIGVATGLDDVFITRDSDLVEPSRLLPLAIADDLSGGHLRWSGHYLVDPWSADGLVDLAEFPRLRAYFQRHAQRLSARHVAARSPRHWYRTIDRVTHALTRKDKLYIPDIKGTLHPVLDAGLTYPHHNLYVVQSECWDAEVLGGLLLSAVGQFFVECYGVRMRGGYLRFQAQYLRRIRVPAPDRIAPDHAAGLAAAFRARDGALATRIALQVYGIDAVPQEA